ncbi:MAG: hypothetical protein QOG51_1575 [Verrucomicrobiota bacterium]|jgi:hypothetical protein
MTAQSDEESLFAEESVSRVWAYSFVIAALFVMPLVLMKDRFPASVPMAIAIGTATVLLMEFYNRKKVEREIPESVIKLSKNFIGLRRLAEDFAFEIRPQLRDPKGQFYLFAAPLEKESPRRLRKVETQEGKDLFVIGPDRFIELLVSELLEGSDKVAELALLRAWERFGEAAGRHSDLRMFIDKLVLETVKAEFRSNWLTLISRFGEKVVIDLRKELERSYRTESTVSSPPKEKKRKSTSV